MGKKISVYLSDGALAELDRTSTIHHDGSVERNTSGRLSSIVERYGEIVRRHVPALTLAEWCAICDANNGCFMDDIPESVTMLWANVVDSPGLDEKWGIDAAGDLVTKMRRFSYAESIAVAEVVQRFWSDTRSRDNHEWLTTCGANIVDTPTVAGKAGKRK